MFSAMAKERPWEGEWSSLLGSWLSEVCSRGAACPMLTSPGERSYATLASADAGTATLPCLQPNTDPHWPGCLER